jgi:hypothetical protein
MAEQRLSLLAQISTIQVISPANSARKRLKVHTFRVLKFSAFLLLDLMISLYPGLYSTPVKYLYYQNPTIAEINPKSGPLSGFT